MVEVSLFEFLFGIHPSAPLARVVNFLLLFVKFFIHRQKLFHQGELNLTHFLQDLRYRLRIEKYLTALEGRSHRFRIWANILDALG